MDSDYEDDNNELSDNSDNEIEILTNDDIEESISDTINDNTIEKKQLNISLKPPHIIKEIEKLKSSIHADIAKLDKTSIKQEKQEKYSPKYKFLHDNEYYRNLVFNGNLDEVKKIKIELELVDSLMRYKWDIWKFFRTYISSMKQTKTMGIQTYFLVKDKTSNKYLGIMSLCSDYNHLKDRDQHIGWNKQVLEVNRKYVLNIGTCVPLNPFGYNFNGGKLLAMLAFSKEVSQAFMNKLKTRKIKSFEEPYPILGLTTTSLYGKSIQYDRLPCLKYLGETQGWSTIHIPDSLFNNTKKLTKLLELQTEDNAHNRSKLCIMQKLLRYIGIPPHTVLKQSYHRGIYFGYLYPKSKELLNKKDITTKEILSSINVNSLSTADEIFQTWLDKYAIKRYENLRSNKRLKHTINFNQSLNEKNLSYMEERRGTRIEQYGLEEIKKLKGSEYKPNAEEIKTHGLEKLREEERVKRKLLPGYIKNKTKITDKFDITKLPKLEFSGSNQHLSTFIPQIIDLITKNPYITKTEIHQTIGCTESNIRTLLNKCKIQSIETE